MRSHLSIVCVVQNMSKYHPVLNAEVMLWSPQCFHCVCKTVIVHSAHPSVFPYFYVPSWEEFFVRMRHLLYASVASWSCNWSTWQWLAFEINTWWEFKFMLNHFLLSLDLDRNMQIYEEKQKLGTALLRARSKYLT